jgi:hypothetical protein
MGKPCWLILALLSEMRPVPDRPKNQNVSVITATGSTGAWRKISTFEGHWIVLLLLREM